MKNIIFSLFFLILTTKLVAQQEVIVTIGAVANDIGKSACLTQNGDILLLGEIQLNKYDTRAFYYGKYSSNGKLIWEDYIQNDYQMEASQIIPINDNRYLIIGSIRATTNYDMAQIIIDDQGNILTELYINDVGTEKGFNAIQAQNGDIIQLGMTEHHTPYSDIFITRYTNDGKEVWEKQYGTSYYDHAYSLVETTEGNIIYCGEKDGFLYRTGWEFNNHDAQFLIHELDRNGELLCEKIWGNNGHDWLKDIIHAPDGGYYAIGSTQHNDSTSFDIILFKLNEDLKIEWSKEYGGDNWEYGKSMAITQENHLYLFGTTASTENEKPDQYLIKTDRWGTIIWEKQIGGSNSDYGEKVIATDNDGAIITGSITTDQKRQQISLIKLSADGEYEFDTTSTISAAIVYPNPARNYINIQIDQEYSEPYSISLYNMKGQLVWNSTFSNNLKTLIINKPLKGIYLYKIEVGQKKILTGKLLFNAEN